MAAQYNTAWVEIPLTYRPAVAGQKATIGLAEEFNKLEKSGIKVLEYRILHVREETYHAIVKIGEPIKKKEAKGAPDPAPAQPGAG